MKFKGIIKGLFLGLVAVITTAQLQLPDSTEQKLKKLYGSELPPFISMKTANRMLEQGEKPIIVHVWDHPLKLPHIPGAIHIPVERLREKAQELPKDRMIILYCGCCPFEDCPRAIPAGRALLKMGFTKFGVLYLPEGLRSWSDAGYRLDPP